VALGGEAKHLDLLAEQPQHREQVLSLLDVAAEIGLGVEHEHGRLDVLRVVRGRYEGKSNPLVASMFGSIVPAAWSFMLAARARGLGTVWTTFHLMHEREAAEILGIPYDEVTQVALIPVAYTVGTDFKPGKRKPLDTMVHWDTW